MFWTSSGKIFLVLLYVWFDVFFGPFWWVRLSGLSSGAVGCFGNGGGACCGRAGEHVRGSWSMSGVLLAVLLQLPEGWVARGSALGLKWTSPVGGALGRRPWKGPGEAALERPWKGGTAKSVWEGWQLEGPSA